MGGMITTGLVILAVVGGGDDYAVGFAAGDEIISGSDPLIFITPFPQINGRFSGETIFLLISYHCCSLWEKAALIWGNEERID